MTDDERVLRTLITYGWANESTGDVECPMGHVALIDLTTERDMMLDLLEEDERLPEPGWYVVVEDNLGLVHPMRFDLERVARKVYDRHEATYTMWAES